MNAKFAATMQASQVVPSFLLSLKHSVLSVKANGLSRPCTLYTLRSLPLELSFCCLRHKVKQPSELIMLSPQMLFTLI